MKKLCELLMCLLLIISVTGCASGVNYAKEIELQLNNKYGKTFVVNSIGGRSAGTNTIQAYVYATDDSNMRFIVLMNDNKQIEYENYTHRLVARKTETIINSIFANYGIDSVCYVTYSPTNFELDNMNVTPNEYIRENNIKSITTSIVIRKGKNVTGENIEKIFLDIHRRLDNVFIGNGLNIVSSDDYDILYSKVMMETQAFDSYRLSLYGTSNPIKEIIFQVSDGKLSKTVSELNEELLN